MKQQDYLELIDRFEASSLTRLEIEEESYKIHMEKAGAISAPVSMSGGYAAPQAAPISPSAPAALSASGEEIAAPAKAAETASEEDSFVAVKAPLVGVFYAAPSPGEKPFVSEGSRVEQGQILCLIEAMKMMNELKSPVSGIIRAVCGSDGQLAEYGQVLFEVEPC